MIFTKVCLTHRYIQGRSQNPQHFYPDTDLKLGVFGFSRNQNNRGLSGAYVTCIYCDLSVKINMRKTPHGTQGSWTHLLCICFCVCGRQKPEDPTLSPMADDTITWGSIPGLGSPIYICDALQQKVP